MSGRLEDLARREQELAAREAALTAKQEHIRKVRRLHFLELRTGIHPCAL